MLQNIFSHRPPLYDVFDQAELYALPPPWVKGRIQVNVPSILPFLLARQSHLGCCFRLFEPKFWKVVGTYKWYSVIHEYRFEWWGHSDPTLCKRICLNFLH